MSVVLEAGVNGLARLKLTHPAGSTAEIYLHGAHLTSWVPAGGKEALFMSEAAVFEAARAIRGGVPIIFPQFGTMGPMEKHGFARLASWRWVRPESPLEETTRVALELTDRPRTLEMWPHPFRAEVRVELGPRTLRQTLVVHNTGTGPMSFTAAAHTYLRVDDLRRAAVRGLRGVRYRDDGTGPEQLDEAGEIIVSGEIDRVYYDAPPRVQVRDTQGRRTLEVRTEGFQDVVVWNPSREGAEAMPDMLADEWRQMICVEPAQVGRPVVLAPGGSWKATQELESIPDP